MLGFGKTIERPRVGDLLAEPRGLVRIEDIGEPRERLAGILGTVTLMSVGMAILSTWSLGFPISFNTFMGTFGLIGIALNDAIVLAGGIVGATIMALLLIPALYRALHR